MFRQGSTFSRRSSFLAIDPFNELSLAGLFSVRIRAPFSLASKISFGSLSLSCLISSWTDSRVMGAGVYDRVWAMAPNWILALRGILYIGSGSRRAVRTARGSCECRRDMAKGLIWDLGTEMNSALPFNVATGA
jgi:hypothetical protein